MPSKRFIAIDGESVTTDKSHDYVLMAASTGDYLWKTEGLDTRECFEFLRELRLQAKSYIFIAFGLNYDVNMWLKDIGKENLKELWTTRRIEWYSWKIEWIPGKWFWLRSRGVSVRIYDVFGFFQSSFVNALKKWDIPMPGGMEDMKEKRSEFTLKEQEDIIDYCISECEALVTLMNKTKKALNDVGLQPSSWVGAGSIASALMSRYGVKQHVKEPEDEQIKDALLRAYFGGRVELFKQGRFAALTDYDVRSAYPSVALHLPTLHGTWTRAEYDPDALHAIWHVHWNVPSDSRITPFPFRRKGNISYPTNGIGWYHAPEVRVARRHFGSAIDIQHGYVFEPVSDAQPFEFIQDEFEHRAQLKHEKHPGEKVLKLGLNAIYGKLAQGVGWNGNAPPFQSFYWAGAITAGTRAKLLDVAMSAPDQLVMIATDGIFFDQPAPVIETGKCLGEWEVSTLTNAFVAQPGVYEAWDEDGERIAKSRGFFAREINFDSVRALYEQDGPYAIAEYESTRFVGLGAALISRDMDKWRKWHTANRKLAMYPNRKHIKDFDARPTVHNPPKMLAGVESERYNLKDAGMEWAENVVEFVQGMEQPLKEG